MKLSRERAIVLELATEAARRTALCEARHFRCAVRYSRTGRERTRLRRDYWEGMAIASASDLREDCQELGRLGLAGHARRLAREAVAGPWQQRAAYCQARGLDPLLMHSIEPASWSAVMDGQPWPLGERSASIFSVN